MKMQEAHVYLECLHKSPCKLFIYFPIFPTLSSRESQERGLMTAIYYINLIVDINIRKL